MSKQKNKNPEAMLYEAILRAMDGLEAHFEDILVTSETELETFLATTMRLQSMQVALRQALNAFHRSAGFSNILSIEEDCLKTVLTYMLTGGRITPEEALELCPDLDVRSVERAKKEARPGAENMGEGPLTSEQADEIMSTLETTLPKTQAMHNK